jgi:hypothetical protein
MGTSAPNAAKILETPATRGKRQEPKPILKGQKTLAKIGMTGSLGALFVSGFLKFKGAKSVHIYSGFGLLAFAVWHHILNQPKARFKRSSRLNS